MLWQLKSEVDALNAKWQITESKIASYSPSPYKGWQSSEKPTQYTEMNERLTKQIENNVHLLENLNGQLVQREQTIAETKHQVSEKDQEVREL